VTVHIHAPGGGEPGPTRRLHQRRADARYERPSDDGLMLALGQRVERERLARGMSVEKLGRSARVSTGLLSQIERGIGNPSLSTLRSLAAALRMPLTGLLHVPSDADMVVRAATRKRLVLADRNLVYDVLVPDALRALGVYQIELPPGFSNEHNPYSHPGEECNLVIEGHLEAHIGERTYLLDVGDTISMNAAEPHWFRTFTERAVVISSMTPPSA
jgi:transcriptional regulator with XRE-family HTH domain